MLRIYQNSSIKDANKPSEAGIYSSTEYLFTKLEVWYNIDPPANRHIATENHNPKLKPKRVPAIINPIAIKKPIVNPVFKNEKSVFVNKTTAVSPVNNAKVIIAAWLRISGPDSI